MGGLYSTERKFKKTSKLDSKHICQQKTMADLEASVNAILQEAKADDSIFDFSRVACYLKAMLKYPPIALGTDQNKRPVHLAIQFLSDVAPDKLNNLAGISVEDGRWVDSTLNSMVHMRKGIDNFIEQLLDYGDEYPLRFGFPSIAANQKFYFAGNVPEYIKKLWNGLFTHFNYNYWLYNRDYGMLTYPIVDDRMYCPPAQEYKEVPEKFSKSFCYLEQLFKTLPDKLQYIVHDEKGNPIYEPTTSGAIGSPKKAIGNLAIKIKAFNRLLGKYVPIPDSQTDVYLLERNEQGWSLYLNGKLISHELNDFFKTLFKMKRRPIEISLYPAGKPSYAGNTMMEPLYKTELDPYPWSSLGQLFIYPDY